MRPEWIFALGMIGALAPELVRLYALRNDPEQFHWSWFYMLVSILFAALGGVIALVLPALTYRGALYAGIATPVLINTVVKKGLDALKPAVNTLEAYRQAPRTSAIESFVRAL